MKGTKLLWAIVMVLIIGATLTSGFTMVVFSDISTAENASAYSSKSCSIEFDFEASTEGWIPATADPNNPFGNGAIERVTQSADLAHTGAYSLKTSVDLQPGKDSPNCNGEALVMYTGDLEGHQIKARVWCPTGSIGNPNAPNGIMLFVKDSKWESEYGSWKDIKENTWMELSLVVDGHSDPDYGWASPDFDPTDVIAIGFKIGANTASRAKGYNGPIYLDTMCFDITPWRVPESDYKFDFENMTPELQEEKPFDEHRPYWDIDEGWNATAWRSEDITIEALGGKHGKVLAITCNFSLNPENPGDIYYPGRKGYVGILALPNIDISNKDSKIIQAQIKFEPYVDPYTLVGCIYAYDRRAKPVTKWFRVTDKPIGGHGWNVVSLDLGSKPPESLKQLLKVGIQIYANKPYTGKIYMDNITIGGKEIIVPLPFEPFIERKGTYFEINGEPFYFAGDNCYYPFYKTHYVIDDLTSTLQANGIKVLRTWGFCDGLAEYCNDSTPDIGDGNEGCTFQPRLGEYDELTFRNFDYVIKSASKHGMRLIIPLVNYWSDKDKLDKPPSEGGKGVNSFGGVVQYLEWCGVNLTDENYDYNEEDELWYLNDEVKDQFYTNEDCKLAYKNYVKYILNRNNTLTGVAYKDDPTIFAWELANEPRCPSDPSGDTIYNWTSEMSTYIKSLDTNHMVALGDEGFFRDLENLDPYYNGSFGVNWSRILNISTVDFGTVHVYPDHWENDINWTKTWIGDHITKAHEIGKPVVFEEFGICSNPCIPEKCNKFNRNEVYKEWTKLFYDNGAAGDCVWMIAGRSNGQQEDVTEPCKPGYGSPSGYYPDYDGFTFWNHSQTRSIMEIIRGHAEAMNNKSLSGKVHYIV